MKSLNSYIIENIITVDESVKELTPYILNNYIG